MTTKYKNIFSDAYMLKITYMFDKMQINEYKTVVRQKNGMSRLH